MKTMKRLFALLLSLVMVLSMTVTVLAADGETPDPKSVGQPIADPDDMNDTEVLTHQYVAYQILTGTWSEEDDILSDLAEGNGINIGSCQEYEHSLLGRLFRDQTFGVGEENLFYPIKELKVPVGTTTEEAEAIAIQMIVDIIEEWDDHSEYAKAFARDVYRGVTGNGYPVVIDSDGVAHIQIPDSEGAFPAGYYLIVDQYNVDQEDENRESAPDSVKNLALLQVLNSTGKVDIIPKVDSPTIEKKVLDVNDSEAVAKTQEELEAWFKTEGSESDGLWQDSADYDIGDHIPFLITYRLGRISDFQKYFIDIYDYPDDGLTYDKNAVVKVDGKEIAVKRSKNDPSNANNFCEKVDEYEGLQWYTDRNQGGFVPNDSSNDFKDYSVITIEYTMTLTEDAIIGSAGNRNEVFATFSNNPNEYDNTDGAGEKTYSTTPSDVVKVFTYQTEINKVDQDGKPLAGAQFELYKKVRLTDTDTDVENEDWEWQLVGDEALEAEPVYAPDPDGEYVWDEDENDYVPGEAGEGEYAYKIASYTFTWPGIDDGIYKFVETSTPDGYNTAEPMEFTVSAQHEILSDDPALTSLTVTNGLTVETQKYLRDIEYGWFYEWTAEDAEDEYLAEYNSTFARIIASITNQKGAVLPETGGVGTTIFYILGGVLLLAATVLLITKKRVGQGDDPLSCAE